MAQLYYTAFTVNSAQVPSTQTNFPMLILPTDTRFKTTGSGGHVANSNGYDIRPYSDSALTSALTYQLVPGTYNSSTGFFEMWVNVASLANGSIVYLGYGDTGITTDGSSSSTFDASYGLVYHMADNAASTTVVDAKGSNNGTAGANTSTLTTSGQIDGAFSLASSGGGQAVVSNSNINDSGSWTLEAWINQTTTNAFSAWLGANIGGGNTIFFGTDATHFYMLGGGVGGATSQNIPSTGTWFHGALTYASNTLTFYYNGASVFTAGSGTGNTTAFPLSIVNSNDAPTTAKMDEVRFSTTNRSANWITTEYNNQSAPGTFYAIGTEQSAGGTINSGLLNFF